jgi:GT2 family glycosyltransferase
VFIVTLNWNTLSDTLECLRAIEGLDYPNRETVVVDNGSVDGSADQIMAAYPALTMLRNATNLGYTGGCNVGLAYAVQHRADYIWLLNNDTVATPDSLTRLVDLGERHPHVGLISPAIYFHHQPQEVQFTGTLIYEPPHRVPRIEPLDPLRAALTGDLLLVGTALLVKRAVITAIGPLDDRYFAYCEDWDYSLRARRAGYAVAVEPLARVFHKPVGALGEGSPTKEYLIARNRYLVWMTHLSGWPRLSYPGRYLAWVLERVHNARLGRQDSVAAAALDGAWDAFRGRFGRPPGTHMPAPLKRLFFALLAWHPFFWTMLLRLDFAGVAVQAAGRLFRRRPSRRHPSRP